VKVGRADIHVTIQHTQIMKRQGQSFVATAGGAMVLNC